MSLSPNNNIQTSQSEWQTPMKKRPWESIHRWLWANTSNEKSIQHSYLLEDKTFYFVRQICFVISLITWTMSQMETPTSIIKNFQYLTEWGVNFSVIYFGLALRIMKDQRFAEKHWKTTHVIFECLYSAQFVITALYWGAIYPTVTKEKTPFYLTLTILEHGGIYLLVIVDNVFNRIKFYKRHMIHLFACLIIYLSINFTVSFCFEPVYSIINWKTSASHIFIMVAILATFLHFVSGRIIYELFKKKKIERASMADDYFFTDQPLSITHFNKFFNQKYVNWAVGISLVLIFSSTAIQFF